jgi:hypothetical protein
MCSAVMFTRLLRHLHPGEEMAFTYRAQGYGPGSNGVDPAIFTGQENAILDFRFSPDDRKTYDERAHESSERTMFHDGAYGSCTKLIADIGKARFGLDVSNEAELIRWADMIDTAGFPSAKMAVARSEPVLHLMTVVEQHGNDAFLQAMVPRLLEEPLEAIARGEDIEEAFAPLAAQHEAYVELVKQHAVVKGDVVIVDLSSVVIDVAAKFVTYSLWPDSAYSVSLSCSPSKCKISIGYNPWSPVPRRHNIAAICERHGGGGHPVVGAISLPADQKERARQLANEIAEELGV